MANITPTITQVPGQTLPMCGWKAVWASMQNSDVGLPAIIPDFADKTTQVAGTFGAGGSVAVEGNLDGGATYYALTDPQGTTIAITTAGVKGCTEAVINVRPHVTAGDGTTSLTVTMFFRKTTATP